MVNLSSARVGASIVPPPSMLGGWLACFPTGLVEAATAAVSLWFKHRFFVSFLISLDLFYEYECFACMFVTAPHLCLVPEEVRRGHWILWNSSWMILSHQVCARTRTQEQILLTTESFSFVFWSNYSKDLFSMVGNPDALEKELTNITFRQKT